MLMATKNITTSTQYFTDRNDAELCSYLRTIRNSKPLPMEKELALGRIIQQGGKAAERAMDRLVEANLRFVVSVAKQYDFNDTLRIVDLIQEGNCGLVKAARLYDPSKGVKFISFAVHYIRQAIGEAVSNYGGTIRLPYNKYKELRKFREEQEKALQKGKGMLTVEEYCAQHDYDAAIMHILVNADSQAVRTDATLRSEGYTVMTFGDMLLSSQNVDDAMSEESMKHDLQQAMNVLSPLEKQVLCLKYGIGCEQLLTNEDIAAAIGKKRERTRQIVANAQEKLAHSPFAARLKYYLAA